MSWLGIDVGTTGVKVVAFRGDGTPLGQAYREHTTVTPGPGRAELDSRAVWTAVRDCVREVAAGTRADPVRGISVSSLGEAVVPVTRDGVILGPSILNFDTRGEEYLGELGRRMDARELYATNGNTLGNQYTLTKLLWLRDHERETWDRADHLLHWSGFLSFLLGAEPHVDYSLANRTLLFDIRERRWSRRLATLAGLDLSKLPPPVPSGTDVGVLRPGLAEELGLPRGVRIAAGAHDQCSNAVGAGVTEGGVSLYGMGTYLCIVPVHDEKTVLGLTPARREALRDQGLNLEHHASPGRFVSFLYNQGGSLVRWYRDTFARREHETASAAGGDVYPQLFSELDRGPSPILVLPHFTATGPPRFLSDSSGVMVGLTLETTRGDVLRGIAEGAVFYLRECVERLPEIGFEIREYRAVGGGSRSDAWVQLSADILDRPFRRPRVSEAGALGAAILAAAGSGAVASITEGARCMVQPGDGFDPDPVSREAYNRRYERYREMVERLGDFPSAARH